MDPVTRDTLAANPLRTLGLPGGAGQAQIVAAARQMRLWPDESRVPPTPWDAPWLGAVRRSRPDIEQAVSLLNGPETRLRARLLWFNTPEPLGTLTNDAATSDPLAAHGAALLELQRVTAGQGVGPAAWPAAIGGMVRACTRPELAAWLAGVEAAGRFDKPSSATEQADALVDVPRAVAAGLVRRATAAFDADGQQTILALADAVAGVPGANEVLRELGDRVEDLFNARADAAEAFLRDKIRTVHAAPWTYYAFNVPHAKAGQRMLLKQVRPALAAVLALSRESPDRHERVATKMADLLMLASLSWEWAGRMKPARDHLQEALTLARGTPLEGRVYLEAERVGRLRRQSFKALRARVNGRTVKTKRQQWTWAIVVGAIMLSRLIVPVTSDHKPTYQPPSEPRPPLRLPGLPIHKSYVAPPEPFPDPDTLILPAIRPAASPDRADTDREVLREP